MVLFETRPSQRGVSLLEVMIYLAVMAILGVPLAMVTVSVSRSSAEGDLLTRILERNRSALNRIVSEYRLSLSGTTSVTNSGKTLQFTSNGGFNGTGAVAGPIIRYEIRTDPKETINGKDDNGNGIADESILVRVNQTTGEQITLAAGLKTDSCSFTQVGKGITIGMSTEGIAHGAKVVSEAQRTVTIYPRN
jgi:type II secretory pathway pseudopilin PulG